MEKREAVSELLRKKKIFERRTMDNREVCRGSNESGGWWELMRKGGRDEECLRLRKRTLRRIRHQAKHVIRTTHGRLQR